MNLNLGLVRFILAHLALGVLSWLVGLLAYQLVLHAVFHQTASRGDWHAVVGMSAIVFFPLLLVAYWPVFLWLNDGIAASRRLLVFPLVGALMGIVPLAALGGIVLATGPMFSPESTLLLALFASAGVVWGIGYAFIADRV